jgi:cell wall-associated NlpC family hydrolase
MDAKSLRPQTDPYSWVWVGQYVKNGRNWPTVDCWGFAREVLRKNFSADAPLFSSETPRGYLRELQEFEHALLEIPPGDARPGDLCGGFRSALLEHIGVVCAPGYIIHITAEGVARVSFEYFRILNKNVKFYRLASQKTPSPETPLDA